MLIIHPISLSRNIHVLLARTTEENITGSGDITSISIHWFVFLVLWNQLNMSSLKKQDWKVAVGSVYYQRTNQMVSVSSNGESTDLYPTFALIPKMIPNLVLVIMKNACRLSRMFPLPTWKSLLHLVKPCFPLFKPRGWLSNIWLLMACSTKDVRWFGQLY